MRSMSRDLVPLPSISASTAARSFSLPGPAAIRDAGSGSPCGNTAGFQRLSKEPKCCAATKPPARLESSVFNGAPAACVELRQPHSLQR